jgi:hypothetical protein
VQDIYFYNNYFYGQWAPTTAQYYSNGWTDSTWIYNNVFSIESASPLCSGGVCLSYFVEFGNQDSNMYVYNNTFSSDVDPGYGKGAYAALVFANSVVGTTAVVEGNIFSGFGWDIAANPPVSNLTSNYNLHNVYATNYDYWIQVIGSGGFSCHSAATCATHGVEQNSIGSSTYSSSYPGFYAIPNGTIGSGNWRLLSNSPAVNAFPTAATPTTMFTTDILGGPRPQGSAWTIGAYEFKNIAKPTNLRISP